MKLNCWKQYLCMNMIIREFCNEWLWNAKEASKYRQMVGDEVGVCYNEEDFIEYLNTYIFPDQPSTFTLF